MLARSRVREVVVVGRRGPAQAAFTNPELLELGELTDADVVVDADELERALAVHDEAAEQDATSRRNVEILREYAQRTPTAGRKRVVLRFLLSPGAADRRRRRRRRRRRAGAQRARAPTTSGALRARATDERETIAAGLVFRAIGYRGEPLPGVSFDERAGMIPNDGGRVLDADSRAPLPGEYVVGWIKRGPSGVIGTNKKDAQETVDAMLADLAPSEPTAPAPAHARDGSSPRTGDADAAHRGAAARAPAASSSPTPAGRRSTATSASSASSPGARASSSPSIEQMLRIAASEEP